MKKQISSERRKRRTRLKVRGTGEKPRLSVFRSQKYLYAQIIDDEKGETLVSCGPKEVKSVKGDKKEAAAATGEALAKKALKKGIKKVVFDRGGYLYHGRVAALANGARKGGLDF